MARQRAAPNNGQGLVILDGDDTLWKTQELFDAAKGEFERLLWQHEFRSTNLIEMLDYIDSNRAEHVGFLKSRFTDSLLATYFSLCAKERRTRSKELGRRIRSIGDSVFAPPHLYEDTLSGLEALSNHYSLVLATKGDSKVQDEKIDALGLRPWFHKIYTLERKTEREYSEILSELGVPRDRIWVVGNSVKSDINPALRLGLRSILIPRGIWKYEEDTLESGDLAIMQSLEEAVKAMFARDFESHPVKVLGREPKRP